MANLSVNDGDMSEFEKLANSLEFENKQYVKMIEKENQLISSLQTQIQEKKELIHRAETDISRLDEDTMRLHKQFLHTKDILKSLKDTYNVMIDHEMALTKQLETLKIKSDEEREFYQEQMTNYSKTRDEYLKKYRSFPFAQELEEKKKILTEMQKESAKNESIVTDLQQKIAEKEAILDSKVRSRMIVKMARLKLSTLQTEKEVHKCLVEKTSLLEQLKEIQRTQEHSSEHEEKNLTQFEDDKSMECDDDVCDKTTDLEESESKSKGHDEKSNGFNTELDKDDIDLPQAPAQEERLEGMNNSNNESEPESYQQKNFICNNSIQSNETSKIQDNKPHSEEGSKLNQFPQINEIQKLNTPDQNGKEPLNVSYKKPSTSFTGVTSRFLSLPQFRAVYRPLPKVPTFKPIERHKSSSKEVSKQIQNAAPFLSTADTSRLTVPTFTQRKPLPTLPLPRFSFQGNKSSDSNIDTTLKRDPTSSKPPHTVIASKECSTPTRFNAPKLPQFSAPTSSSSKYFSNTPKILTAESNMQISKNPIQSKSALNQNDDCTSKFSTESQLFEGNNFIAPESVVTNEISGQKDEQMKEKLFVEQPDTECCPNSTADENIGQPLFKPTTFMDPFCSNKETLPSPKSPTAGSYIETLKSSEEERFNMGSVFKTSEENSHSPTAFSLINLGNIINADHETPFLSFGNCSAESTGKDEDEDRPNSLLNLFSTSGKEPSSKPSSQFNFNLIDSDRDEEKGSFFNFGKSDHKDDDDSAGGFFNFGKGVDKDDESERKGSFFKLF